MAASRSPWPSLLGPLLLFASTGLVGLWAAYDLGLALRTYGPILVGVVVLLLAARAGQRLDRRLLLLGCYLAGLLGGVLGLVFLVQQVGPTPGPSGAGPSPAVLYPNAVGGALALLLPFWPAGLSWAARRHSTGLLAVGAAAGLALLAGLAASGSRGAWVGLLVGGLAVWGLAWPGRRARTVVLVLAVGALALLLLVLWPPGRTALLALVGGSGPSRLALWWRALALLGDYPLTGSGPGTTALVYASYVLLTQVPYYEHLHNLYLQIALDQGLLGLLAWLLLAAGALRGLAGAARGSAELRWVAYAALVPLVGLLFHGLVDAELWVSPLAPLLFLPLGLGWGLAWRQRASAATMRRSSPAQAERENETGAGWVASTEPPRSEQAEPEPAGRSDPAEPRPPGSSRRRWRLLWLAAGLAVVALTLTPAARAMGLANLGAVEQTRFELSRYRWPRDGLQDTVRRDEPEALAGAIRRYQAALALDPANPTANRRLGQIALSLGQYESAHRHLLAAYEAAPQQRATRQLLGESFALQGDPATAVQLWRTVDTAQRQLELRLAWYESIGDRQAVSRFAAALALLGRESQEPG
jgi:O-antigen ligase